MYLTSFLASVMALLSPLGNGFAPSMPQPLPPITQRTPIENFRVLATPEFAALFEAHYGRFDGTAASVRRLRDVFGSISQAQLQARLDAGTRFTERFGPGALWHDQMKLCTQSQVNAAQSASTNDARDRILGYCLDLDDSVDWFVVQTALYSIPDDWTVTIPGGGRNLVFNSTIAMPPGSRIEWLAENGVFSYFEVIDRATPNVGSLLSNYNVYGRHSTSTSVLSLVTDLTFIEPHIDGNFVPGQNALGFARGAKGIRIEGGTIRELLFDPTKQGGRAVQCEDGCEDLVIDGLAIQDATFGISSTALHKSLELLPPGASDMMLSDVTVRDVSMENVEAPFSLLNTKFGNSTLADRQEVLIEDVTIRNSGALTRARVPNRDIGYFSFLNLTTGSRAWCINRTTHVTEAYQTEGEWRDPQGAGIFAFQGGRNITIRNVSIENDASYPAIGGVFRGEYGANISMSDVTFRGDAKALLNFTGGISSPTVPSAKLIDARFTRVRGIGSIPKVQIDITRIPFKRAIAAQSSSIACTSPAISNAEKIQGLRLDDVTVASGTEAY